MSMRKPAFSKSWVFFPRSSSQPSLSSRAYCFLGEDLQHLGQNLPPPFSLSNVQKYVLFSYLFLESLLMSFQSHFTGIIILLSSLNYKTRRKAASVFSPAKITVERSYKAWLSVWNSHKLILLCKSNESDLWSLWTLS